MVQTPTQQAKIIIAAHKVEWLALGLLLGLSPLMKGSVARWAFIVCFWLFMVAFAAMLIKRMWLGVRILPLSKVDLPMALFVVLAGLSWLWSINSSATLWALYRVGLYVGVFYITLDLFRDKAGGALLATAVLTVGTIVACIGLIKYLGGPVPAFWDYPFTSQSTRLNAVWINADHAAGYFEMIFLLGLGLLYFRDPGSRILRIVTLLVVLLALCLTLSRGAWVGTAVAVVCLFVVAMMRSKVKKPLAGLSLAGLVLVLLLIIAGSNPMIERLQTVKAPSESTSLTGRIAMWKGTLEIIKESPWGGTGLGTFPWSFAAKRPEGLNRSFHEAHNDYLQIISELGILAIIPLAWGIFITLYRTFRHIRYARSGRTTSMSLGAVCGMVAILVHSIFDFNIQITSNGILFSLLAGLSLGATMNPPRRLAIRADK